VGGFLGQGSLRRKQPARLQSHSGGPWDQAQTREAALRGLPSAEAKAVLKLRFRLRAQVLIPVSSKRRSMKPRQNSRWALET